MDLSRWKLSNLRKITARASNVQEFLAEVLDGDHSLVQGNAKGKAAKPAFSVETDFTKLSFSVRPKMNRETSLRILFESLTRFFEAGFYLTVNGAEAPRLQEMFFLGESFKIHERGGKLIELPLPAVDSGQVVRGRARSVFEAFGIETPKALLESDAFLFSPVTGSVFMVICNRPHPWQVEAVEQTFLFLREQTAKFKLAANSENPARSRGLFK